MMPEMCVIYGANTTRNAKEEIYIHAIPYLDEKKEIMGRICSWNARELETCGPATGDSGQFLLKAFRGPVTGFRYKVYLPKVF